ncbi:MAG: type I-C CRISPR-associated protein Cas7/Csd2 [Christensenella sp.]
MEVISNRSEFVVLFDVENGNPNGDPDAGNMPRVDAETGYGLVTDVCTKRKIRNYVQLIKNDEQGLGIFIKEVLNETLESACVKLGLPKIVKKSSKPKALIEKEAQNIKLAQQYMCKNYYDVRTFGAVMSTGDYSCGVVRGPVQINFAKSVDPIEPQEITITRMAITKSGEDKETEMGKKNFVPYGLYRQEGYISARLAQDITGFDEADRDLLFEAIENMFEHDHSAARGKMTVRRVIEFRHEAALGNAPSHKLFELVKVKRLCGDMPARGFEDYEVSIDEEHLPEGVEIKEYV